MNIGFLGTGHITYSIILGIFKSNLKIKKIYISPRNITIAKKLSKRFKKVTIAKDNQQLINKSSWVFLAITPQVGKKILSKLNFKQSQKIVSFISTINLAQLKKYIGKFKFTDLSIGIKKTIEYYKKYGYSYSLCSHCL